ncbi:MAG: GH25 family lysozyme [Clostridium sp.]|nr:hypothetical protein [[Clostridium] innocuum]
MMKKIIDISEHNGKVNLKLASDLIDGIVCRCSWGWGENQIDLRWHENAQQAVDLKIPLFAYHFCYARNINEAIAEAKIAIKACKSYKVNVLYYDIEYSEFQGELSTHKYYDIAKAFCDLVESSGIPVGIYANENYFRNKLVNKGFSAWTIWLAHYGSNNGYNNWSDNIEYNPFGNVLLHQFTSNAKKGVLKNIKGIPSDGLDCSADHGLLKTFAKEILSNNYSIDKTKKVKVKSNSTWYDNKTIPSFVYQNEYDVIEEIEDRVVIGIGDKVTGAIKKSNLYYL